MEDISCGGLSVTIFGTKWVASMETTDLAQKNLRSLVAP